jgi:hypothetical protein
MQWFRNNQGVDFRELDDANVEAFAKIPGRSGDYDLSQRKRRGKKRDKKMEATIDFLRNSDGTVDDLDDDQVDCRYQNSSLHQKKNRKR